MPGDPYYRTPQWRALRSQALSRDHYRCTAPGCTRTYRLTVDHIISRERGGPDRLSNLRTLCIYCDSSIKEDPEGFRYNGGVLRLVGFRQNIVGCDLRGRPLDGGHPWSAKASMRKR